VSQLSITESPNELTGDIDLAPPEGIVRLLRAVDAQIFSGYQTYPGLTDEQTIDGIVRLTEAAAAMLGRKDATIVLAGAGTSGRLGVFLARRYNQRLARRARQPNLQYAIAGGDRTLIRAQEGAEDDPHKAWDELREQIRGKRRVLYVGITCGFSAAYVAGQLWRLCGRAGAFCVLLGFNPIEHAQTSEIESWDRTFADVVARIRPRSDCLILNPVLGPEALTGSTRMKGGSATKLILETAFALAAREPALRQARNSRRQLAQQVRRAIRAYEATRLLVYEHTAPIAELIAQGGRALRAGGHIYYLGSGPAGILGLIDAAECPPTFGADFGQVRGFLEGGWHTLLGPGRDPGGQDPFYRISLDDFVHTHADRLTSNDLVVALIAGKPSRAVLDALRLSRHASARIAAIHVGPTQRLNVPLDALVSIDELPARAPGGRTVVAEFAIKLVLNALSTGAHILSGKVYRNRMVDLRISNKKLYSRALRIIQDMTGVSAACAKRCLLRSIYRTDRLTAAMMRARPAQHVAAASQAVKVVPKALILATGRTSYRQAEALLQTEPIVRVAVARLLKGRATRTVR